MTVLSERENIVIHGTSTVMVEHFSSRGIATVLNQ